MISGINHITFSVKNLDESFRFYHDVLGLKPLMRHSKGAYFLAGDLWFCIEEDEDTRKGPLSEYTHFAFSIASENFHELSKKIIQSGARTWKENTSEGNSLYFLDPNGHKLEVHVGTWQSRLDSMKKEPWEDGIRFFGP